MSDKSDAERAARMRQQAEHRAIVQATMQAKRSGKIGATRASSPKAEAGTALLVVAVVIALLVLVVRYAN